MMLIRYCSDKSEAVFEKCVESSTTGLLIAVVLARRLPLTVCPLFSFLCYSALNPLHRRLALPDGATDIVFASAPFFFFWHARISSKAIHPLSLKISFLVRNTPSPSFNHSLCTIHSTNVNPMKSQ
jgi:hypothetical protein